MAATDRDTDGEALPAKRNPRRQGDLGELSAMEWLASKGARIYVPVGHSPDVDFIAEVNGQVLRIEVKTSTYYQPESQRWYVGIATRGGNQSWSGLVKYFEPERCDYLFVVVGDGRRWFIPAAALGGKTALTLGGPKYEQFEVEQGTRLQQEHPESDLQSGVPGEYRSGQPGDTVNVVAKSFAGSNPASPTPGSARPPKPTKYERSLGRSGHAIINQKRRLTIPQRPLFQSGLRDGETVHVRADGPGRLIVERAELPGWAKRS